MSQLLERGFEVAESGVDPERIAELRNEVDIIGRVCIRNLCSKSAVLREFAVEIGERFAPGLLCVRSILFNKTPELNWPVAWHQDLTIAVADRKEVSGYGPWSVKDGIHSVQPPVSVLEGMVTIRVHLDDATAGNGALRVVPRSHLLGKVASHEICSYTSEVVTCECRSGDVLLMSPLILHSSNRSSVPSSRRVLHFEYAPEMVLSNSLEWIQLSDSKFGT